VLLVAHSHLSSSYDSCGTGMTLQQRIYTCDAAKTSPCIDGHACQGLPKVKKNREGAEQSRLEAHMVILRACFCCKSKEPLLRSPSCSSLATVAESAGPQPDASIQRQRMCLQQTGRVLNKPMHWAVDPLHPAQPLSGEHMLCNQVTGTIVSMSPVVCSCCPLQSIWLSVCLALPCSHQVL
jgi:hypothetical protein